MRSIKEEIKRHYIYFGVCLVLFIVLNMSVSIQFMNRYTEYIENYQRINRLGTEYNQSRTYFHLYNKEREESILENYLNSCNLMDSIIEEVNDIAAQDRDCCTMLRIVKQMEDYRRKIISSYLDPLGNGINYDIDYIEELDLLLQGNLNNLTTDYLDYISRNYEKYAHRQMLLLVVLNVMLLLLSMSELYFGAVPFRKILESLEKLRFAANEINSNNFDGEDLSLDTYEELSVVGKAFNEMKHAICEMLEEIKQNYEIKERLSEQKLINEKQKRRLVESKMKELQMQINPHFLFNTLSLVIRSIQLGEAQTAITLIKATSKILRGSIDTNNLLISIDDEIELLEAYIYIQRIHCKGRIKIGFDIRKAYDGTEVLVPPLIIQPIVENAIKHGLADVVENGKVDISIVEMTEYYKVTVSDNGVGMSDEALQNLKNHKSNGSIGLLNVQERLEFLYQKDDAMQIITGEEGTTVIIHLYKIDKTSISGQITEDASGDKSNDTSDDSR